MSETHVTVESWQGILRGERIEGERALALHLDEGCDRCEEVVAGLLLADGLDGEADHRLLAFPAAGGRDRPGFERIMRQLRLESRVRLGAEEAPAAARTSKVLPLSLAGALALAGMTVLLLQLPRARSAHEWGEASFPEVSLSFSVAPSAREDSDDIERGVPNSAYSDDRTIGLQYELSSPAFVTLVRMGPHDRAELLAQPGRMGPGRHDLLVNDTPVGVSLRGFVGRNRFGVIASLAPLSYPELAAVAASIAGDRPLDRTRRPLQSVGVGFFDIEVEPAHP
jgi:hypothetical protein